MIRLCTYAIKMMKRFNKDFKSEQFDIRHIANPDQEYLQDDDSDDEEIEPAKIQTNEVFALIVPFLHEDNIKSVEDAIIKGNEKTKRIATYVVTIFSEVESMTKLSKQFKNIYIVNILCVVKMNSLIEALTNNCKVKYDFTGNEELVNQIMYMSNKEIRRKEKIIELNS